MRKVARPDAALRNPDVNGGVNMDRRGGSRNPGAYRAHRADPRRKVGRPRNHAARKSVSLRRGPGSDGVKRPSVIGTYTNDIVYDRLAPGVLDELRRINPPVSPGRRRHKHFQWLTGDVGHPKLKEHLVGVMALMRAAPNWGAFQRSLQRAYPKLNETLPLPFDD